MRIAHANFVIKTDFNRKITSNKTKDLLVENELNKLKTFDSSYFIGKSHFHEDGTKSYLVLQLLKKFLKLITNKLSILSSQSKGKY